MPPIRISLQAFFMMIAIQTLQNQYGWINADYKMVGRAKRFILQVRKNFPNFVENRRLFGSTIGRNVF